MDYPVLAGLLVAGAVFGFLALSTYLRPGEPKGSKRQEPTDAGGNSEPAGASGRTE